MLGKGRAEAITPAHMAALADEIGCHPATLEAIATVESGGFGWDRVGRIKILFEKHKFYKYLRGSTRDKAVKAGLARRRWISPKKGGYREQRTSDQKYAILGKAMKYGENAALRSISMGRYQIMGFNYAKCGFKTVKDMWAKFLDSEVNQLAAFRNFLIKSGLKTALRKSDFNRIEEVYNGGGLNGAYARRMATAEKNLKRGKWKGYKPGSMPTPLYPKLEKDKKTGVVKQTAEDINVLSTGPEKAGAGLGAAVSAVAVGFATAWQNGLWLLLSVLGVALVVFIIWRVVKRK